MTNILFLTSLFGCQGSLQELYDREKRSASQLLQRIPKEDWNPDVRLRMSYEFMSEMAKPIIDQKINTKDLVVSAFGQKITLNPNAKIKSLRLRGGKDNEILFSIDITGDVALQHAVLSFNQPYKSHLAGKFTIQKNQNMVQITPNDITKINIEIMNIPAISLRGQMMKWIKEAMKEIPPIDVMDLDLEPYNALDYRFNTRRRHLDLDVISKFPQQNKSVLQNMPLKNDWELSVSNNVLSSMIKNETYSKGVLSNGIVLDARTTTIEESQLVLNLRIWKLRGWGQWWRDYEIKSPLQIEKEKISLKEPEVALQQKSSWANVVDPIAAIGEGFILESIEKQLNQSLPTQHNTNVRGNKIAFIIDTIEGKDDWVHIAGKVESQKMKRKRPTRKR